MDLLATIHNQWPRTGRRHVSPQHGHRFERCASGGHGTPAPKFAAVPADKVVRHRRHDGTANCARDRCTLQPDGPTPKNSASLDTSFGADLGCFRGARFRWIYDQSTKSVEKQHAKSLKGLATLDGRPKYGRHRPRNARRGAQVGRTGAFCAATKPGFCWYVCSVLLLRLCGASSSGIVARLELEAGWPYLALRS